MSQKRVKLVQYSIYKKIPSYPGQFVLVEWDVEKVGKSGEKADRVVSMHKDIKALRLKIPEGYTKTPRFKEDDKTLVETWI